MSPLNMSVGVSSPMLAGRAIELELLERALDASEHGDGGCLFIAGVAGVGKSRLLAEVRSLARTRRFLVLQGACFEQDSAFPWAPMLDALRNDFSGRSPAEVDNLIGPLGPELVKLMPELALILHELQPSAPLDAEAEKRRTFESLTRFITEVASKQPLLLILEDLHWSDDLSLEFLHVLTRRIRRHRVLLLCSCRADEAPPQLTHLLAQLERDRLASMIELRLLERDDVAIMLEGILQLRGTLRADLLDLICTLTDGNPFAVEEMIRAFIDAGDLVADVDAVTGTAESTPRTTDGVRDFAMPRRDGSVWRWRPPGDLRVPGTVQAAVQRRTSQLDPIDREVLTIAAVAGRRFEFALLGEATGLDDAALTGPLKRLVAAQLVVEEAADRFVFRHALSREATMAQLLQRERQQLHARVAAAIQRVHSDELDRHAADLGYHAHASQQWQAALDYCTRAGLAAQAAHAPRSAIEHFNRALNAAERLGPDVPPNILHARGRAYETIGYFEAARGDYERALAVAAGGGDTAAEWQSRIALGRLWASRDYVRTGEHFHVALQLARAIDDAPLTAISLNRLGNWHANVGRPDEALRSHREALQLVESTGDRRALAETLDLIGMASQLNGELAGSYAAYSRAIELWRELQDRRGLAASLASLPLCSACHVHEVDVPAITLHAAAAAGDEAVSIARDIGWRAGEAYALSTLGMVLGPLGEYRRAFEAALASLACAEEIEHRQWIIAAHTLIGLLHADVFASNDARTHFEHALQLAARLGSSVWRDSTLGLFAAACAQHGDHQRADSLLRDMPHDTAMQTQSQRLCWYARAELELARRRPRAALEIADALLDSAAAAIRGATAGAEATASSAVGRVARLSALRGRALAADGHHTRAVLDLEQARDAAAAAGARPMLWRTRAALGRSCYALGRRHDARAEFEAARATIHELAVEIDNEATRREFLHNAQSWLPRRRRSRDVPGERDRPGGLTRRQREVAVRVAQGATNQEIAEELGLGLRTIETHVSNIFVKLGFSSRTQIAWWAATAGLTDQGKHRPPLHDA